MHDQPLKSVDQSLVHTGEFLAEFAADTRAVECLETFCKCTDIVEWLRKETKGEIMECRGMHT